MGGSPLQLHCPLRDTRCVGTWQHLKILTILNQLCSCKHLRLTISRALTFVGEPPGDMLWGGGMSSQSSWTPSSSLLSSPDSILPRPPPELHLQMPPGQDCPILACVWVSRPGSPPPAHSPHFVTKPGLRSASAYCCCHHSIVSGTSKCLRLPLC